MNGEKQFLPIWQSLTHLQMYNILFVMASSTGWKTDVHTHFNNPAAQVILIYLQLQVAGFQQSIGWDHFVQGRMAIEWGNIINQHIASKPTIKHNAEFWGTKLLKINWKYILELWDTQNDEVKGSNQEEQNSNLRRDMIEEIIYLQHQNPDLPFELQFFINNDLAALEDMTTNAFISYLYGTKLIMRTHHRKLTLLRKIIRHRNRSRGTPRIHQNPHDKSELDRGK
jgi:hypothetical protein